MPWTAADIPDQTGRTIVVTGANSGLGFETCLAVARKGARVVLACRDQAKGARARDRIAEVLGDADLELRALDLASLASIRAFADGVLADHPRIDVLVNNAGVMAIPRRETADGFEMQLGTNHFGHFALTGLLLHRLDHPGARVVTVSSGAHKMGRMDWDDLDGQRRYSAWGQYGRSKLANLLFTYELDRRLRAAARQVIAVAAHPGYADTNLQLVGPQMQGSKVMEVLSRWANTVVAQPQHMGALPQLFAATAPDVTGGAYFGPDGLLESRGHPHRVSSNARSHDVEDQRRLWEVSVERTGVDYGGL